MRDISLTWTSYKQTNVLWFDRFKIAMKPCGLDLNLFSLVSSGFSAACWFPSGQSLKGDLDLPMCGSAEEESAARSRSFYEASISNKKPFRSLSKIISFSR